MKTLELNLQKRLLILEGDMLEFKLNDKRWLNDKIKFICKGSELTEEVAKGLIEYIPEILGYFDYTETEHLAFDNPLESFISAIEAQCYYWKINPMLKSDGYSYVDLRCPLKYESKYKQAESKTFNPEKSLIFEIL